MANHDVPQDPGCAAVLEHHVVWPEGIVKQRYLLVLDDDRVAMDEAFGLACGATGIQDVEGMGVWNSSELEGLVR